MSTVTKILISFLAVAALGATGFFVFDRVKDSKQNKSSDPENIVADYKNLLAETERLKTNAGANCDNKKSINQQIDAMEKKLTDLAARKKGWLDSVPKLPDLNLEEIKEDDPLGRPGSEVPELSSDVPPLPNIDEIDVIDPEEYIFQIEDYEQKINNILQELKILCQDKENSPAPKKVVSDKCSDACQRHKDCTAYTEDVTVADLNDAYDTCMEECTTWSKEIIKCINGIDIKKPNDCVSFVNCQLPQFYEEKYLK